MLILHAVGFQIRQNIAALFVRICNPHAVNIGIFNPAILFLSHRQMLILPCRRAGKSDSTSRRLQRFGRQSYEIKSTYPCFVWQFLTSFGTSRPVLCRQKPYRVLVASSSCSNCLYMMKQLLQHDAAIDTAEDFWHFSWWNGGKLLSLQTKLKLNYHAYQVFYCQTRPFAHRE